MATNGFVSATALLKTRRFQRDRISMGEIVAAVAFNDKARFELAYQQVEPDYIEEGPARLGRVSSSEQFKDIRFAQWTVQLP